MAIQPINYQYRGSTALSPPLVHAWLRLLAFFLLESQIIDVPLGAAAIRLPDTAERVLIHADTSVHPDLLNVRFGYVAVSRASYEAEIYTDSATTLSATLGKDVSKSAAVEFARPVGQAVADRSLGQNF